MQPYVLNNVSTRREGKEGTKYRRIKVLIKNFIIPPIYGFDYFINYLTV